jgi:hypothetical protein
MFIYYFGKHEIYHMNSGMVKNSEGKNVGNIRISYRIRLSRYLNCITMGNGGIKTVKRL